MLENNSGVIVEVKSYEHKIMSNPGNYSLSSTPETYNFGFIFIAYGNLGLPKLIREINESKKRQSSIAMHLLKDDLFDDEKCFRAIKLHIVKRYSNRLEKNNDFENLHNICLGLKVIATHLQGAQKIIEENIIIKKLYNLINADDMILKKSSADVLLRLASHFESMI